MAYTLAQLQSLQDAFATGELEVSFEGKTVRYRSIDDLKKAIDTVSAELTANGLLTESAPRRSYAVFSKD
jgi:hypothetical protein